MKTTNKKCERKQKTQLQLERVNSAVVIVVVSTYTEKNS